jgi:hypothetical protein
MGWFGKSQGFSMCFSATWLRRLRNRGALFPVALLGLAVLTAMAVVGPIAAHIGGSTSVARAVVAAAACLAGAEGALVVNRLLREPQYAFSSLLFGISLRMGVPLFLGLILYLRGSPLANAEFLVYLGGFYAITLTVGVYLSLPVAP